MVNFLNCKWGIFFLLSFIFFNYSYLQEAAASTTNKNIEITSTISTLLKAESGETITIPLKVYNISTNAKELIEKIKLPEGWNLILKPTPFTLKAEETEIRLLTFLVSSYCLADDYTISYLLIDASAQSLNPNDTHTHNHNPNNPEIELEKKFQIRILPTYKIEIIPQGRESSSYVIAGEDYRVEFKIINRSNAPQEITLTATDSGKYPLFLEENRFCLEAGKSKIVKLTIKIPPDLINLQEDRISLIANLKDLNGKDMKFYHYSKIQLIPRVSGDADIYHRLPSALSLKYKQGEDLYLKIKGKGILNDAGNTKINYSLHLNKFSFFDDSLQKKEDYSMRLTTEETNSKFNFYLGKTDLKISPLIKNDIFYDGIGGSWKNENFHIGAYYVNAGDNEKEGNEQKEKGYAISFGGEPFNNGWEIKLNYLNTELIAGNTKNTEKENAHPKIADIFSVEIKKKGLFNNLFSPEKNIFYDTNLELEYAQGNINQQNKSAFRSRISGKLQSINFAFSGIYAEPGYPGGIEDINYQKVFLSKNFGEKLSIGWNYQNQNKISTTETKKSNGIIFNYHQQNSRLFLLYQNSIEEDFLNKKNQDLYQFYFSHKGEKIHLKTHYKLKYVDDNLGNNIEENNKLYISAEYSPRTNQKYNLSYFSESNHFFASYKKRELKFSAQYPLKVGDIIKATCYASQEENLAINLNLDLSYKHEFANGLELELGQNYSLNKNKDLIGEEVKLSMSPYIGISYKHKFSNGGTLELKGLYSFSENTLKEGVNSAEIAYHIPFGIPLGLKKDIGKIKGKIYIAEDPELSGIKGVMVRLNNFATITDNQGDFLFQGLKAGEYYLQVDYSSLDENSITTNKTPLKLKVEQGEEVEVNIGICRKAIVKGEIIQYDFPLGKLTEKTNLIKKGGINSVYLELKNKNSGEIRRCMSDREGRFVLDDLRPGEWLFSITGINLPSFYYIANYPKELDLKAGEICKFNIQILPLIRQIKMIGNENNVLEINN